MKYLIVGLGNIGSEYENTRHNIGFMVLDALAKASNIFFESGKLAFTTTYKFKGRTFILIKPTTYMNLSGKAVNYYLQQEKIKQENLLVITDDIALPFGTIRLKGKGSDGGHNGLKNIVETLGNSDFARLRFGVGSEFVKGKQINHVLGEFAPEEKIILSDRLEKTAHAVKSFGTIGLGRTMSEFNGK
ncbi:MAG: aminoacyl-tRNA hydrolase [Bacteroidetes bacterium RIFCSPLOWO2_12_FULL_31_6]|nr:MAG: aminoacyl-tRNA hydrolase [Bacteroidetes bacterium RIFCSPLOWO2_12_FULL_31_6]